MTGDISYEPANHQKMTDIRQEKIEGIADFIPEQEVAMGESKGKLAVVGWGSTYGAIHQAVKRCRQEKLDVSHIHIRYLNPLPKNLGELLSKFDRVLVPELNSGQLLLLLRAKYLVDAVGFNKVEGQPFKVSELMVRIEELIG